MRQRSRMSPDGLGAGGGDFRPVGAEAPHVAFEITRCVLARAVVGVLDLSHNLGAGCLRPLVMRVHILDRDVDTLGGRIAWTEHDDARSELDLGVLDRALVAAVNNVLLESERPCDPCESSVRIVEAQEREHIGGLLGHSSSLVGRRQITTRFPEPMSGISLDEDGSLGPGIYIGLRNISSPSPSMISAVSP